ncbi:MAG: hypothetical protein KJ954_14300, partial [Alphaproteobacteria bacterium]|nr:hypothetical protein [Alphaproteobacteria bacterium]
GTLTYLAVPSMAQGDIFYADTATSIARLGAGTSGNYLKTQGAAANPVWTTPALNAALYIDNSIINSTGAGTLKVYTMPVNTIGGTGALRITQVGAVGSAANAVLGLRVGAVTVGQFPQLNDIGTGQITVTIQGINSTNQRYQSLAYIFGTATIGTSMRKVMSGTLTLNVDSAWVIDSTCGGVGPVADHLLLVEKLMN